MAKAYERPNSKIRMIINIFIAEDYRGLTIEEIRDSNYGLNKINITNYDRCLVAVSLSVSTSFASYISLFAPLLNENGC